MVRRLVSTSCLGLAAALGVLVCLAPAGPALAKPAKGQPDLVEVEPPPPPNAGAASPALARARDLYEKKDYANAAVELDKVLKGGTQDSEANKQQAEYLMGKTLYHLGYYAPALARFDAIVTKGAAHHYHRRTLVMLAALAQKLPESSGILKKVGAYTKEDLLDPALEPLRGHLFYLLGRNYYLNGQIDEAIATLREVPRESEHFLRAKYLEAVCWVLVPKAAEAANALKEILTIAAEPSLRRQYKTRERKAELREFVERAHMTMGRIFYSTKQYDKAIKYYEKLPQESPRWVESLFEASWAYYLKKLHSKALGNIHTLNAPYFEEQLFPESLILRAQIYFNYCRYDRAMEAVTEFQAIYPPIRDDLRRVVAQSPDDNTAFYEYVKKIQAGTAGLPEETQRMAQSVLQDRTLEKTFEYVAELQREIKQIDKADAGWKGSRVAGDIKQELTLQESLAQDSAGSLARERLQRLVRELTDLRSQSGAVKISILEARVGNKRKSLQGQEVSGSHRADPIIVDDEHQTWNFAGEYWKDELGFYRYRIASQCPVKR